MLFDLSSLIAFAGLLSARSAAAFHAPTGVLSPLPRESRAFAVLQARAGFSAAERAARRAARAAGEQQNVAAPQAAQQPPAQAPPAAQYYQAPGPAPAADALDAIGRPAAESPQSQSVDDMLAVVLSEFVQSDYARECCNYCNIMPLDYGQVEGMFEKQKTGSLENNPMSGDWLFCKEPPDDPSVTCLDRKSVV